MKKLYVLAFATLALLAACKGNQENATVQEETVTEIAEQQPAVQQLVKVLTEDQFILAVADYTGDKSTYKGSKPCVIDFYADWCGPCKRLSPLVEAMAEKYQDQVLFYKVDVDAAPDLAAAYGISSIPCLFFCANGKMTNTVGLLPEEMLEEQILKLLEKK